MHSKQNKKSKMIKACLFDLDGVVFDTEPLYTLFWREQARKYHPEIPDLEHRIKGQTLVEIYDTYFADVKEEQPKITAALNDYEQHMAYNYVEGFEDFAARLRQKGIKLAVVTSSNREKMECVYRQRPEMKHVFDAILTSEDFSASKPSPDCYLKGATRFGVKPEECVVFEDSFNGLKSGRASGAYVVGLSTTNAPETIAPLADKVIADFKGFDIEQL